MKSKRQLKSEAFLSSKRKKPLTAQERKTRAGYTLAYSKVCGHRFVQPSITY